LAAGLVLSYPFKLPLSLNLTISIPERIDQYNPMKRKYIMIGLLLLASLGLFLASYLRAVKEDTPNDKLAYSVRQSANTFQQYSNADFHSAKAAILTNIKMLDQFSSESSDPEVNPFAADAMVWYVRLSKLEEKNKNIDEKTHYIGEAISRCHRSGNPDCSEIYLRQLIARMDAMSSSQ
jgi:hypothetical protein